MLLDILLLPFIGPIKGLLFVGRQVEEQMTEELFDPDRIRAELMALNSALESGVLGAEEFEKREADLMSRLRVARARQAA
jgi:hypothetical protein